MLDQLPLHVLEMIMERLDDIKARLRLESVSQGLGVAARGLAWGGEGTLELRPLLTSMLELRSLHLALRPTAASHQNPSLSHPLHVQDLPKILECVLERSSGGLRDVRLWGSREAYLFPQPAWVDESLALLADFDVPLRRLLLTSAFAASRQAPALLRLSTHSLTAIHVALPTDSYPPERQSAIAAIVTELLEAASACAQLEELSLELSPEQGLSETAVRRLLEDKSRLRELSLIGVGGLSGGGLRESIRASGARLSGLRLSGCPGLLLSALCPSESDPLLADLASFRFSPGGADGEFLGALARAPTAWPALRRLDFADELPISDAESLGALVAAFLRRHRAGPEQRRLDVQAHASLLLSTGRLAKAVGARVACASAASAQLLPQFAASEHCIHFTADAAAVTFTFCLDRGP